MRCILLLLAASWCASGQETLTLEDAVRRALREHPALSGAVAETAVAAGRKLQSGLRPNPRVILQVENLRLGGSPPFRFAEDTDDYAYLEQAFELGGKRRRRVELASAEQRMAALREQLVRQEVAAAVRSAYWQAVGRERVLRVLRQSAENFRRIVQYHETRVEQGAMAEADLIRVRLEADRILLSANTAAFEAERALIELFRRMGLTSYPEVMLSESLDLAPDEPQILADEQLAVQTRAETRLARQAVEIERANLELQRAQATPDLNGLFGYKRAMGLDSMIAGVQMSLPLWNRNQGSVAASAAGIRRAEADAAAAEAMVRAEVRAAQVEYTTRRRQLEMQLARLRADAAQSSEIAQAAYHEGAADLLRMLDAERMRLEVELLYFETATAFRLSQAALEAAMGKVE